MQPEVAAMLHASTRSGGSLLMAVYCSSRLALFSY